jgi:excisionase family DNA binding protein
MNAVNRSITHEREQRAVEPLLLTVEEVASLLRTTRKAIYSMIERGQLPGVLRIGRRVLICRTDLLDFLYHNCAPSPKENRR